MQYITHAFSWNASRLSYLLHLQSPVFEYEIVEFRHFILREGRFGAPRGGSFKVSERPGWDSFNHLMTVVIKKERLHYTTYERPSIPLWNFSSWNQNGINDQHCFFSISIKSGEMPDSTRSHNRTTNPIRLKYQQEPSTAEFHASVNFLCDSGTICPCC